MKQRIAIGGIHIESSTFTPYISGIDDFRILRGQALLDAYPFLDENCEVEYIPLISARALPGGVVSRAFYEQWRNQFFDLLAEACAKAPLDGVLFDIHGAMSVQGMTDAEGALAQQLRAFLGAEVLISTTMDLHGNVSDDLFAASDLITCYRTAPHIDVLQTKRRALNNLIACLNDARPLLRAKVEVPILLPGEKTSTEVEPGRGLYAMIDDVCRDAEIVDAAIWMGFPWADQARCRATVVATGRNRNKVEMAALNLANHFWAQRAAFRFVGPTASAALAIEEALDSTERPFFISDTGDNPGAGGAGDMVVLLKQFLAAPARARESKKILFASIYDGATVEQLYACDIGQSLAVELGGKVDPAFGGPLKCTATVVRLFGAAAAGRCALLRIDDIDVIVTERRFQYGRLQAFVEAGLADFDDYDIIVVKMGYLEPELSAAAKGWSMALTPGAVNQDIVNIDYKYLKRPLYPFDDDFNPELNVNCLATPSF